MRAFIVLLLVLPAFVLLAGCANGVAMTDDETIACRNEGCTPWTQGELKGLADRALREGYRRGWRDAMRQRLEEI